jgi:hypothetical protein
MWNEVAVLLRYYWNDHTKDDEMSGTCRMHRRKRRAYRVLVRKLEGKKSLGRP